MITSTRLPQNHPEELYAAVDLGSNSFHLVIVRVVAGRCNHGFLRLREPDE